MMMMMRACLCGRALTEATTSAKPGTFRLSVYVQARTSPACKGRVLCCLASRPNRGMNKPTKDARTAAPARVAMLHQFERRLVVANLCHYATPQAPAGAAQLEGPEESSAGPSLVSRVGKN